MNRKTEWNIPLIAAMAFSICVFFWIVYAICDVRVLVGGGIATAIMTLAYFATKKAKTHEENNIKLWNCYFIGFIVTFFVNDKIGVPFGSCLATGLVMPILFWGLAYLLYMYKNEC